VKSQDAKQVVVRLDREALKKLESLARLLSIGEPLSTSEAIRATISFAAMTLPQLMPIARRAAELLGQDVEPLREAFSLVAALGLDGAHKQLDEMKETQMRMNDTQGPAEPPPAMQVVVEVGNLLGSMKTSAIQVIIGTDGSRRVWVRVRNKRRAHEILNAVQPAKRWPGYELVLEQEKTN
jgi:hypothetical protein